jgi:hypothetical protein
MRRVASAPAASNAPMTPSPSLSPKQGGFDLVCMA